MKHCCKSVNDSSIYGVYIPWYKHLCYTRKTPLRQNVQYRQNRGYITFIRVFKYTKLVLKFEEDKNHCPEILNLLNRLLINHIIFLLSIIHILNTVKCFVSMW